MRIRYFLLSFLLVSLLPCGAAAVLPPVRQILITDSQADPLHNDAPGTNPHGTIFFVGYGTRYVRMAGTQSGMVDPVATAELPDRRLVVADATADPLHLNRDTGALWIIDPADHYPGVVHLGAASPLFRSPADVLVEPDGTVLMLDSNADPKGWGSHNGALFRIDPISHAVDLLAAPATFARPRCLAYDLDGNVLVLDVLANPQGLTNACGAIFKVNPHSGAISVVYSMTAPPFKSAAAVAVVPDGPFKGDMLVVDKDADPSHRGNNPGAVFRIPRGGGSPVLFADYPEFVEPIDILCGAGNDVLVLDRIANPLGSDQGRGAVFRFDRDTGAYIEEWASAYFQALEGIMQHVGATMDSSTVTWTDETQGLLQPGDFVTVRARLRNFGTESAPEAAAYDTLEAPWSFVAGTDSAGSGTTRYDPVAGVFSWKGSLAQGDSADLRFRIRLADDVGLHDRAEQHFFAYAGKSPSQFIYYGLPQLEFDAGARLFVDVALANGQEIGKLYLVNSSSLTPTTLWSGPPLMRPSDVAFLDDGSIAILDRGSTDGTLGAILQFNPVAAGGGAAMSTLFPLERADGFVEPSGITVDRDGSILIVDRDANPLGFEPPDNRAGAVFRLDPKTRVLSLVMSDRHWKQPLDAVVDRKGKILVIDPGAVVTDPCFLWEVVPGQSASTGHTLPSNLFKDPTGLCVDKDNNLFITDPTSPAGGGHGAILYVTRSSAAWGFQVASNDQHMQQPVDCDLGPDGVVLVADREANPTNLGPGDHGAVFALNTATGSLLVSCAGWALRQPDGSAVLGVSDLASSYMRMFGPPADPQAGDTLRFEVGVVNTGTRAVPQCMASLDLTPTLALVDGSSPRGRLDLDESAGIGTWSGRVACGDTMRFTIRAVVLGGATYGVAAGGNLTIYGTHAPLKMSQSRKIRAPFRQGDLILVDQTSNPSHLAPNPGAIYRLGDAGDPARVILSQQSVYMPSSVVWSGSGDLIMATTEGIRPGALYRFNATAGYPEQLAVPDSLVLTPTGLVYSPQGELYLVDRDTPGPVVGSRGAVFRLDPYSNRLRVFASDSTFRAPFQAVFGPGGHMYVADGQADPGHFGGNTGTIFTIDEHSGHVLSAFQSALFADPTGVTAWDDSTLLVTDQGTSFSGGQFHGALFFYRPFTQKVEVAVLSPSFRTPWRTTRLPSGELLILDPGATTVGHHGRGVVFGYDLDRHFLRIYAASDSFSTICDLARKPGPLLQFVSWAVTDLNGPPLHPADRVELRAVLRNDGPVAATAAAWADTVPAEVSLLPATAEASGGSIGAESLNSLRWIGDVAPGDSVVIRFEAQLNPALSEGRLLQFAATLHAPITGSSSKTTSIPTYSPLQPGFLYLADGAATPFGSTGGRGAIFKVNLTTGSVIPMMSPRVFRHPRSIALTGLAHPRILVLDDQAQSPEGRGCLFLIDPVTQEVTRVGSHASWVAPRKVLPLNDNEALVLDPFADPFNLTPEPGPGALFKVNLTDKTTTPIFSDTTLVSPCAMAFMRSGLLAIADADADPNHYGGKNGAIFTLDLDSLRLNLFAASPQWQDPTALASRGDGSLVLLESNVLGAYGGRGVFYNLNEQGDVGAPIGCPGFTHVSDIEIGPHGYPFVSDLDSDPLGMGRTYGAIYEWDPAGRGTMLPLASSMLFDSPLSFFIYRDMTPVESFEAQAQAETDGILLHWQVPAAEAAVRFLLYRRAASGPDDPGDPSPEKYDLIASDRDFTGPGPHEYIDGELEPGAWYVYLITKVDPGGTVTYSSPLLVRAPDTVLRLALAAAVPNPFRRSTSVRYVIPAPGGDIEVSIFDVSGRRVRVLDDGHRPPGRYACQWDGADERGHRVGSGLYFARLSFGRQVKTGRMVLLP